MENTIFSISYSHIVRYLPRMKSAKNAGYTQPEFKTDFLENNLQSEVIQNETFMKFFDIAWEHCEDEEKALDELDIKLKEFETKNNQAQVLKEAIIAYQILTKTAEDGFKEQEAENYFKALKLIAFKRTATFLKTSGKEKIHELIPVEKRFDKFGPWEIDPLFGHLRVFFILPKETCFPEMWRTDDKITKVIVKKYPNDYPLFREIQKNELSLTKFVQRELNITDPDQLNGIMKTLNLRNIYTLQDLNAINNWEDFGRDLPAHIQPLQVAIERFRNVLSEVRKAEKPRTEAELLGDWHKFKLFLYYESGMEKEHKSYGFLDKKSLCKGFEEQRKDPDFDGGPVLISIEEVMQHFTEPNKPLRKHSHGIMLYGPPGTGKTQLCSVIIKKAGLFGLVPPLSSSELNRSKVGETEQLLMSIFYRGLYVPYLLCCIAIDEVDALTPKRNEKSGEHKVDVLCLLLSLIGGIKDVPNVFVIASTNRLNKIDEAFARRLQDKFYVGRLNADQRINLIKKIQAPSVQLPNQVNMVHGAAMVALRSQVLYFFDSNKDNRKITDIDDSSLIKICAKVANDFQIKIGGYSIPILLKENNINDLTRSLQEQFTREEKKNLTGRILIDLRPDHGNIQFETFDGDLKEIELNSDKKFTADIVPILLIFAIIFEVPYFQLIDSNLVLSNAAFDENTSIEMILERLSEYEQYENAMFAFDADTLIGVTESMSDSAMSESLSYSIQNSRIWQQVILHSFKAQFGKKGQKSYLDHRWCILISSSEFVINQFKKLTKFEWSQKEYDFKLKERTCVNCELKYIEKENKSDSCSYHPDKYLHRIVKLANNQKTQLSATKEQLMSIASQNGNTDIFNDYFYLCCMRRVNETDGCKKGFHKDVNAVPVVRNTNKNKSNFKI